MQAKNEKCFLIIVRYAKSGVENLFWSKMPDGLS
jgi:hypothetical protein